MAYLYQYTHKYTLVIFFNYRYFICTMLDFADMFLPSPSDLLVNLADCKGLVEQLLEELPHMVSTGTSTESALGSALQAAFKIASPTG